VESLAILQVLGQQEFLNILRSVSAPVEITGANVTGLNTEHFEEKKKKIPPLLQQMQLVLKMSRKGPFSQLHRAGHSLCSRQAHPQR